MPRPRHQLRSCLIAGFIAVLTIVTAVILWQQNDSPVAIDIHSDQSPHRGKQPLKREVQDVDSDKKPASTALVMSRCPSLLTKTVFVTITAGLADEGNTTTTSTSSATNLAIDTEWLPITTFGIKPSETTYTSGSSNSSVSTRSSIYTRSSVSTKSSKSTISSGHTTLADISIDNPESIVTFAYTTLIDTQSSEYLVTVSYTTLANTHSESTVTFQYATLTDDDGFESVMTIEHTVPVVTSVTDSKSDDVFNTPSVTKIFGTTATITSSTTPIVKSVQGHTSSMQGYTSSTTGGKSTSTTSSSSPSSSWDPPSLWDYMHSNVTRPGEEVPPEVWIEIQNGVHNRNSSIIVPKGSGKYCIELKDDPCIDPKKAWDDKHLGPILRGEKNGTNGHDGNDDDDDDHHHHHHHGIFRHFSRKELIALLATDIVPHCIFDVFDVCFDRHWFATFGSFLGRRSRPLFDLLRHKLSPADRALWGFDIDPTPPGVSLADLPPPAQPLPPGELPPAEVAPTEVPPDEASPPKEGESDKNEDGEDPDDGTSSNFLVSPLRDPPVIRLLTKRKNPDCPPKLQQAQAEIREKNRQIEKLKADLESSKKAKDETEDDLETCDEELDKLHKAQKELTKVRSRNAAQELRDANAKLREKQILVDLLHKQLSETSGDKAGLEQQLSNAEVAAAQAKRQREDAQDAAESALDFVRKVQDELKIYVDTTTCSDPDVGTDKADSTGYDSQFRAFRAALEDTETRLQDANARASTAEGIKSANEAEIARLQSENKQMAQHTCPVSILTQPTTCKHTNEEIGRMKLTLEACEFDRSKLRSVNPKPIPLEADLPLVDQLARCHKRWHKALADKASIAHEYERMTKAAQQDIARLKWDLSKCREALSGSKPPADDNKPPETTGGGSVRDRIAALESEIAKCEVQKSEIEKGKCPVRNDAGTLGGDAASDPRVSTLEGCRQVLDEASADAKECYAQCSCPVGVAEGPDHLRRADAVKRFFEFGLGAGEGVVGGNLTLAAVAA